MLDVSVPSLLVLNPSPLVKSVPLAITVANPQKLIRFDLRPLRKVLRQIVRDAGIDRGSIGFAVVDDAAITALHGRYLGDCRPTDVLSFVLESAPGYLEGEVVVSAETAARTAPEYGWPAAAELQLYLLHGLLHLVGYNDRTPRQCREMRKQERHYLEQLGIDYQESRLIVGSRSSVEKKARPTNHDQGPTNPCPPKKPRPS
ncbi:MAG: rRNA maturation RNase YbeY [Pirellulales bacterium]|nr:rRNA maturation RNase YbeY [Pirellulales bacterium]